MNSNNETSLQDRYAAKSICFGCGPSNKNGLQIKSFVEKSLVIASFTPQAYHHAFPNILNGGIIASVLDCHCNWAASWYLMQKNKLDEPPCTVTAEFTVKLKRPTPMGDELTLVAELVEATKNKAIIKGELLVGSKTYDEFIGTFIAVKAEHPAYHRW